MRPGADASADAAVDASELSDALISDALLALGGRGVHVDEGAWITYLPEATDLPDDLAARLSDASGLGHLDVELDWLEEADWDRLWKAGLDARRVTDRIVVTPSWIEPDVRPGDVVLVLDPGTAFGNAEHGTTRGCLRLMDGVVRAGDRLLDVGAGSAVLSIAGARLGATACLAVEGDEQAIDTARANAASNGVGDRVEVLHEQVDAAGIHALGTFDGVLCNIEGHYLRPLLPGLAAAVAPDGWLIVSGILDDQWADFVAVLADLGLACEARDADGEWRSGTFRRPPRSGTHPDSA